jgi:hypothetical protein
LVFPHEQFQSRCGFGFLISINLVQLINSLCNKSGKLSRFALTWNVGKTPLT